jgi:hypothetical protein
MRRTWSILLPLLLATVIGSVASCGDDGNQAEGSAASQRAIARADANCRQMLREVRQLAKGVLNSGYSNTLELTTEGFAKPGIALVQRVARRQQALARQTADPQFALYAELFDPIVVLAEQRLHSGQVGEVARSQVLQDLLTGIGVEQRQAARRAGLHDCDVDFLDAMVRAASE